MASDESLDELADLVAVVSDRVSDIIYTTLRAQLKDTDSPSARELEKRLAKVRRSLVKAEQLLRSASFDDED
jgi:hypothetical protein